MIITILAVAFLSVPAFAQSPIIVAPDGTYLGNFNSNPYDPNSIANPYGPYGNPYSPDSVTNPYGRYGNPYSPTSPNNPYVTGPQKPSHPQR
jgi:hypothetical protein